jgi:polyisoprenoid-binding protein YceI
MKPMLKLKKLILPLTFFSLLACDNPPKGDEATVADKQEVAKKEGMSFKADTAESRIRFNGLGVGKNHPGKFKLNSGTVAVSDNKVTGGSFIIDINSMELEQQGDIYKNKLRPHLLSGDFFEAEKFATAKFEITGVEPYEPKDSEKSLVEGANFNVSGNFTLKGTTKNITFPARIELDDNVLKAKANFDIDRTQWQMNYGNDKTLGDKFISETVNIELNLKANREGSI